MKRKLEKYRISQFIYATAKSPLIQNEIRRFQKCGNTYTLGDGRNKPFYCNKVYCLDCQKRKYKHFENRYKKILKHRPAEHVFYLFTIAPDRTDGNNLRTAIDRLQQVNKQIRYFTKKNFIGGITRLELTYEPHTQTYKPHLHIILEPKKN